MAVLRTKVIFGLVRFGLIKPTFSSADIILLDYTWKLTRQKCEQMRRLVCGWLKGLLQLEQAKVVSFALWWQKRELKQFFIYCVQYRASIQRRDSILA